MTVSVNKFVHDIDSTRIPTKLSIGQIYRDR